MDLLVHQGLDHPYGLVKDMAAAACQRCTGQQGPQRSSARRSAPGGRRRGAGFVKQRQGKR